jgi:hypothetical protein
VVRVRQLIAAGIGVLVFAGLGAGAAIAGEVKGPPGSPTQAVPGGNPNKTGVTAHANSICATSGLNDYDTEESQNDFHVQSFGIDVSGHAPSEPVDPHVVNPSDFCRGAPRA